MLNCAQAWAAPPLPRSMVAVQMVINPLPVVNLGSSDASFQIGSGRAIESPVARPEGDVSQLGFNSPRGDKSSFPEGGVCRD